MSGINMWLVPKPLLSTTMAFRATVEVYGEEAEVVKPVYIFLTRIIDEAENVRRFAMISTGTYYGRHILQKSAKNIGVGVYRLSITHGEERHDIPEILYVVEPSEHMNIRNTIYSEPFVASEPMNRRRLQYFLTDVIHDELLNTTTNIFSIQSLWRNGADNLYSHPDQKTLYSSAPVQWVVGIACEILRYIAFGGLDSLSCAAKIDDEEFSIRFFAEMKYVPLQRGEIVHAFDSVWQELAIIENFHRDKITKCKLSSPDERRSLRLEMGISLNNLAVGQQNV